METGLLRLLSVLLILPASILQADVAPPVEIFALVGGAVIGLGLLVVVSVVVAVVVIRAIKKKNTGK